MSPHQRAKGVLAAVILALGVSLGLSACAPAPTQGSGSGQQQTQQGQPDSSPQGDQADSGGTATDGGTDPAQDTVRTGPVAQYGGPAYGDQGDAEIVEPGVWCKTIAVFWGGDEPIPDGVRFTFKTAVPDQPGLDIQGAVCGTAGADRSCLGMTVEANESGIVCSIEVLPTADFVDGTTVSFTGTLECPTSEICDAVAARQVDPGPPIVVNTPEGA
jgi:hypothetical protein